MSMEKIPGPIDAAVAEQVEAIARTPEMAKAIELAKTGAEAAMKLQVHLCEIPAPTFEERVRAEEMVRLMKSLGLEDVTIDGIGNVVGRRPGKNPDAPLLAIGAHMDTVFPAGTDVTVHQEGNIYRAPGIGDNCSGLRCLLEALRCMNEAGVETQGDIWFCGTVGEEGLGDIRGSKYLFRENNTVNHIDGFLAVDNSNIGRILFAAVGSHRWRFTIEGPGGHSYGSFGETASAIHAMCLAGARIAHLKVPADPKTTFTIGTIKGGTTVNTIAARCEVDVDMRSTSLEALDELERTVLGAFEAAVAEENARWPEADADHQLRLVKTQIGNRPAGQQPDNSPAVQATLAAMAQMGLEVRQCRASSTDANKPISIGVPSVCIGTGGVTHNEHSLKEFFDSTEMEKGPQLALLIALALVGRKGEKPMLEKREG